MLSLLRSQDGNQVTLSGQGGYLEVVTFTLGSEGQSGRHHVDYCKRNEKQAPQVKRIPCAKVKKRTGYT